MSGIDLGPLFESAFTRMADWLDVPAGDVRIAFWTILVGVVCNASCALLGCYLVLRRMSLVGDAISHAILPGLAVGFLLSGSTSIVPMLVGAMLAGLLTTLLTQTLHSYARVPEDASMGVVYTTMFAVGVILISQARHVDIDTDCVLYGEIAFAALDTVPLMGLEIPRSLQWLIPVAVLTVLFVVVFWKELKLVSFDAGLAVAMGFSAVMVHYLLMGMVAFVSVAAFKEVGSILVIAMLIVPAATAHLLTDRLSRMMVWAVLVGSVSAVGGYPLAFRLNTSPAGMMAVVAGGQFCVAAVFAPRHGFLGRAVNNLRLSLWIAAEDLIAIVYRVEERAGGAGWRKCVRLAGGGLLVRLALPVLRIQRQIRFGPGWTLLLTDEGRARARSLVRSHRLWESYLSEHFELPTDHLHEPASRLEHYIGPDMQQRIEQELQQPDVDPHGQQIPPSDESSGMPN